MTTTLPHGLFKILAAQRSDSLHIANPGYSGKFLIHAALIAICPDVASGSIENT
jgi:hypothetical protein